MAGDENTKLALKNCGIFTRSVIHLNDEHIETADNLNLVTGLYNMIEYSDNFSDSTASLHHYKKPEQILNNAGAIQNISVNSPSFKYQSNLSKNKESTPVETNVNSDVAAAHRLWKNIKIVVPSKYLSSFFRSIELPFINTKLYIELNWTKNSVMRTVAGDTTLQIIKTELHVPVVTLNTKNTKTTSILLEEGFKRSLAWNEYKSKIQRVETGDGNENLN